MDGCKDGPDGRTNKGTGGWVGLWVSDGRTWIDGRKFKVANKGLFLGTHGRSRKNILVRNSSQDKTRIFG